MNILYKGTLTVENKATEVKLNNVANKKVLLKNCAPFTNCISIINNAQVKDGDDIDVVVSMNKLIEYNDSYTELSRI